LSRFFFLPSTRGARSDSDDRSEGVDCSSCPSRPHLHSAVSPLHLFPDSTMTSSVSSFFLPSRASSR
ncbi:hypothetical protein PFISCL1PPCAC_24498, partial [Pristionchus fissidentatus]